MNSYLLSFVAILMSSGVCMGTVRASDDASQLIGFWHKTQDEDAMPSDIFELRADGTYVNYGFSCHATPATKFRVITGDIYVKYEVPGKGPIAIIFRPSADRQTLTFTSPRTRHNASYERMPIPSSPCGKQS
jgi:hypothetical protein